MIRNLFFVFSCVIFSHALKSQWNIISTPQSSLLRLGIKSISIPKSNVIWASAFDTSYSNSSASFFRTVNGGTSWVNYDLYTPGNVMDIVSLSAINSDTAWAALNRHGGGSTIPLLQSKIMKTTNGGLNWAVQSTASFTGPMNHINFIHFLDENTGICIGDSNTGFWEMYKTLNGGANWNRITAVNIPSNNTSEKGVENCFSIYNNTIWFGTTKGRIYKSLDFGSTWSVYNTPLQGVSNISMKDSLNGLASNGVSIIKTIDGGLSWTTQLYTGTFFSTDFCAVHDSANTYVSVGWGSGNYGSSYTNDNGLSWHTINSNLFFTNVHFANHSGWAGSVSFFGPADENDMTFFKWPTTVATSLKTLTNEEKFNIYPNPFMDEIRIEIGNESTNKNYSVMIYNILGILVGKQEHKEGQLISIDSSSLPKGTYMIQINNGSEFTKTYHTVK
jgi:photosystem II stability/assembly factor-like uncharacterized protein